MAPKKSKTSWKDVKVKLTDLSDTELIKLIHDLYVSDKNNQHILHARFDLGDDVLGPYKATIHRWLWPDFGQDTSVGRAKKAIADYKNAGGQSNGLAELMVFYCEQATGFIDSIALEDETYFDALIVMFENALDTISTLPLKKAQSYSDRLENVRHLCHRFGYGVGDEMDELLANYGARS
ncbi:hypothetical protein UNDKW_3509 [Undibacterium sp. KW1]|uniref:hypothetical protein n=1 Tax=Undibacterium sp. KW1 TaxID=2058624 RepID=UPI001331F938|nr:hypothetical protein [Undibacterium sp. KW1]BBB61782.1 hypothetical protein UNDKW_3509 [Undibacterium sp. KW1]